LTKVGAVPKAIQLHMKKKVLLDTLFFFADFILKEAIGAANKSERA